MRGSGFKEITFRPKKPLCRGVRGSLIVYMIDFIVFIIIPSFLT